MINFDGLKLCQRCENPIVIGGYVYLPGTDIVQHLCLKCAVETVKEYNEERGLDTKEIRIVKSDFTDEEGEDICGNS